MTESSIVDLVSTLDDCENPYSCPHGRPVIVKLDETEIEDWLERDYSRPRRVARVFHIDRYVRFDQFKVCID